VDVISFTGSTSVGRWIQQTAGARLAKICLELGGKNPLIVCDDADLELAANWAVLSAFSNAGQRCASGSRIIVFDKVYEKFRDLLVERTRRLRVGCGDDDDFGPVINQQQLESMLQAVATARHNGTKVLIGGQRLTGPGYDGGFFMAPTLLEGAPTDPLSQTELFGPISSLYRVIDFESAIALANDSPYGLTAAIHTADVNRAMAFTSWFLPVPGKPETTRSTCSRSSLPSGSRAGCGRSTRSRPCWCWPGFCGWDSSPTSFLTPY
jgi:aldehyde dehydrogenase (NAD+)